MFSLLFVALIIIWISFYALIQQILTEANEQLIKYRAEDLLTELCENIELMERINYTVSQMEEMRELLLQDNLAKRHAAAVDVHSALSNDLLSTNNRFSIVVFDNEGWFYRFSGSITVTECERLSVLLGETAFNSHLLTTLDGNNHIGFSGEITDDDNVKLGTLFVLESEQNFLDYYYDSEDDLVVSAAILSGENVISTNAPYIGEEAKLFNKRQVGITPFQVATWLSSDYDNALNVYYIMGVILLSLLMIVVLMLFVRMQSRKFFAPLIHVMNEADRLGADGTDRLQTINNVDFDNLILGINNLLSRIDLQNETVKRSLLRAEQSKTETQQAINALLKKQINAHFVINTLSTIQILQRHGDTEKCQYSIAALSDMIRYAFEDEEYISVWDELTYLQKYIDIMNVRYDNKIAFELEADDRLMDVMIPRMILQPIIENSILHGFVDMPKGCLLTLTADYRKNGVVICITDNGCGMSDKALSEMNGDLGEHGHNAGMTGLEKMAVYNVKRRIYNDSPLSRLHVSSNIYKGISTTITIHRCDR